MSRHELRKLADFREMAEAHLERLGQAIQIRRKELRWSRARLGREVNAHEKTVERWEKAQTAGAMDNIEQIAEALDMNADELLAKAMPDRANHDAPDFSDRLAAIEQNVEELAASMARLAAAVGDRENAPERQHKPPAQHSDS